MFQISLSPDAASREQLRDDRHIAFPHGRARKAACASRLACGVHRQLGSKARCRRAALRGGDIGGQVRIFLQECPIFSLSSTTASSGRRKIADREGSAYAESARCRLFDLARRFRSRA